MATPAPRCSCCYAQRKSRGPEGHGDGTVALRVPYPGILYSKMVDCLLHLPPSAYRLPPTRVSCGGGVGGAVH
jgi:hypothetical protein